MIRFMCGQSVRLETRDITGKQSFHRVFAETMGFPEFYGHNMDAWIDCMSCLRDAGAEMSRYSVKPGEMFYLEVADSEDFHRRVPDLFRSFVGCGAVVNRRCTGRGEPPVLALVLL